MSTEEQIKELRRQIEALEATGELTDRLIAMKESGQNDPTNEEYQALKLELREARRVARSGGVAPVEEGSVAIAPDVASASAKVEEN